MENHWIALIALLIFAIFIFLFWRITNKYTKKEYGTKMWKHWPAKLSYWQAAILYSTGFTVITLFILKSANVFTV